MKDLAIIGAGGFGREVVDVVNAINAETPTYRLLGVVDDDPTVVNLGRLHELGVRPLGTLDQWLADESANDALYVIGIGAGRVRRKIDERLTDNGRMPATLVHPSSTSGAEVVLGPGSILCAGARLTTNIALGRHVHVNLNATIGHDVVVGDYVTINPGAALSGEVEIGTETLVGANAFILQGLTVGARSVVGAASCVTKPVPDGVVVKGVPAR